MSYSIAVNALKKDAQKQFEEKYAQAENTLTDESKNQLEIAKQVFSKELEIAEDDNDIVSFVASGHAAEGYASGRIEFSITKKMQ